MINITEHENQITSGKAKSLYGLIPHSEENCHCSLNTASDIQFKLIIMLSFLATNVFFQQPVHNPCDIVNGGMRKRSPSDIGQEVFEEIKPLLKSGCQWQMLPGEFPKWRTVHAYFAKWSEPDVDDLSVLERAS